MIDKNSCPNNERRKLVVELDLSNGVDFFIFPVYYIGLIYCFGCSVLRISKKCDNLLNLFGKYFLYFGEFWIFLEYGQPSSSNPEPLIHVIHLTNLILPRRRQHPYIAIINMHNLDNGGITFQRRQTNDISLRFNNGESIAVDCGGGNLGINQIDHLLGWLVGRAQLELGEV